MVILDDAYFGLVYEKGIHGESLFAEFAGLDRNVLAVKLDGTTKEDYVWGLRVGFITFAFKGASEAQLKALEAKAAGDVRSGVSNVSSIGQHLAVAAYADADYAAQKKAKYAVLRARYRENRRILRANKAYAETFEAMPFNSGYFMCVKPIGVDAESVRRRLIRSAVSRKERGAAGSCGSCARRFLSRSTAREGVLSSSCCSSGIRA